MLGFTTYAVYDGMLLARWTDYNLRHPKDYIGEEDVEKLYGSGYPTVYRVNIDALRNFILGDEFTKPVKYKDTYVSLGALDSVPEGVKVILNEWDES